MLKYNFAEIWERIQEATGLGQITQLAKIVGTSQQHVSNKKKLKTFPVEWAYLVAKKYGLNIEWILEGTGSKRAGQDSDNLGVIKPIGKWLLETEKKEPGTMAWFQIEFKRSFPEFEKWQKREQGYLAERDTAVKSSIA